MNAVASSWSALHISLMAVGALAIFGGAVIPNLRPAGPRTKSLLRALSALLLIAGMAVYLRGLRGFAASRSAGKSGEKPALGKEEARRVLPGAVRLERVDSATVAGYRPGTDGAEIREVAVLGRGDGHAPGIVVVVGVSADGKILRAAILRHGETPGYMRSLEEGGFLEGLRGRSVGDGFEIGKDLDAVSGATETSLGVAAAVRAAVKSSQLVPALRSTTTTTGSAPSVGGMWRALLACGYLLVLAIFARRLGGRLRLVCLGVSVIVLGVAAGRLFAVSDFARASCGMLPAGTAGAGVLLFLATLAVVTVWRGRLWCSHACPFGALCELGGRLTRARARRLKSLPWLSTLLPWIMMAAVALGIAWTGRTDAAGAEPFGLTAQLLSWPPNALELWETARVPLAVFGLIVVISLFATRFYCRYLCGAGLLLKILSRLRGLSHRYK